MSEVKFTTDFDYPKAKLTRPHVLLGNGEIIRYCSVNAGICKGWNKDDNMIRVDFNDIEGICYNSWHEWRKWYNENIYPKTNP